MLGVMRIVDKAMNYYCSGAGSRRLRLPIPVVLTGIEESMLFVFMFANLMTGGINITLRPLLRDMHEGLQIIFVYCLIWMTSAFSLAAADLRIKFW